MTFPDILDYISRCVGSTAFRLHSEIRQPAYLGACYITWMPTRSRRLRLNSARYLMGGLSGRCESEPELISKWCCWAYSRYIAVWSGVCFGVIDLQAVNRNILAEFIQHLNIIGHKPVFVSGVGDEAHSPTLVSGLHHRGQIVHRKRTARLQNDSPRRRLACAIAMSF